MKTEIDEKFEAYYLENYHVDLKRGGPEMREFNYMDSLVVDRYKVWQASAKAERDRILAALLDEYEMRKLAGLIQDIFNRKISNTWDEFLVIQAVLNPWLRDRFTRALGEGEKK